MPWLQQEIVRRSNKNDTNQTIITDTSNVNRGPAAKNGASTTTIGEKVSVAVDDPTTKTTEIDSPRKVSTAVDSPVTKTSTQTVNEDSGMMVEFTITIIGGLLADGANPPTC